MELSTQEHINIWSSAKQLALPLGRYVALLVSLHGTGLYERFTSWQNSATSSQIVQDFLEGEYAFQEQLIAFLKNDQYYAPHTKPEVISHNRKLIGIWDALSILLCQELISQAEVPQVPTIDGETTVKLTLKEVKDNHHQVTVFPWPFQHTQVELVYEGRLLQQTFDDEKAMREALMGDCAVTHCPRQEQGRLPSPTIHHGVDRSINKACPVPGTCKTPVTLSTTLQPE